MSEFAHILVVDDSKVIRDHAVAMVRKAGYRVSSACDGVDGLELATQQQFDAVLTDLEMPRCDGVELIIGLRKLSGYAKTPIFVLTTAMDTERYNLAKRVGANAWFAKPVEESALLKALERGLKLASSKPSRSEQVNTENVRVLIVDDSNMIRDDLCNFVGKAGFLVTPAINGIDGLAQAKIRNFDVVLTDLEMPKLDGIGLVTELRKLPAYAKTPVFVLTTARDMQRYQRAKRAGATAWFVKPVNKDSLLETLNKIVRLRAIGGD